MSQQQELSRFSASGKTFFFNKGEAKNGTDYLAINAIYGQGNRERTVLFPPHYMEYVKHVTKAVEELTGFTRSQAPAPLSEMKCEGCDAGPAKWVALRTTDLTKFVIACGDCNTVIFENVKGAHKEELK